MFTAQYIVLSYKLEIHKQIVNNLGKMIEPVIDGQENIVPVKFGQRRPGIVSVYTQTQMDYVLAADIGNIVDSGIIAVGRLMADVDDAMKSWIPMSDKN